MSYHLVAVGWGQLFGSGIITLKTRMLGIRLAIIAYDTYLLCSNGNRESLSAARYVFTQLLWLLLIFILSFEPEVA